MLSKALHFNFYQNWSSTVEVMIKLYGVFMPSNYTVSDDLGG